MKRKWLQVVGNFFKYIMENQNEKLPNGMILLKSKSGLDLLKAAQLKKENIIDNFKSQVGRSHCGVASLSLIANAINAYRVKLSDPDLSDGDYATLEDKLNKGEPLYLDEFDIINHGATKDYIKASNLSTSGLDLLQLKHIASLLGYGANAYFMCNESLEMSQEKRSELSQIVKANPDCLILKSHEEFHKFVSSYIGRPATGLILNYDMKKLGYEGLGGHHSPIGAVNNNSILVMDVWVDTDPAWVDTKLLFEAACSIDSTSGLPRGLLHIHELL